MKQYFPEQKPYSKNRNNNSPNFNTEKINKVVTKNVYTRTRIQNKSKEKTEVIGYDERLWHENGWRIRPKKVTTLL